MHDVLVQSTRCDTWSNSVRYAAQLASLLKASLTALYCVSPVVADATMAESFECYAASLGVKHASWVVHAGDAGIALAHMALWHDLLVLGPEAIAAPHAGAAFARLLLAGQLPCLMVPDAWTSALRPASIAVAWDGSVPAVRALHAAIPLLERAGRVVLLVGGTDGVAELSRREPPFDLEGYCAGHDLHIVRTAIEGSGAWSGAALLDAARAADAELLVVGATGRTHMSERLLGSVTEHVLRHCPVPLLLRH